MEFDAIVIGSGATGGWAAKELCEAGLNTLMLDRGRRVEHRRDYPTEGLGDFELPYRNRWTPDHSMDLFQNDAISSAGWNVA